MWNLSNKNWPKRIMNHYVFLFSKFDTIMPHRWNRLGWPKYLYSEAEELQNFAKGSQINKKYLEMLNNIEVFVILQGLRLNA